MGGVQFWGEGLGNCGDEISVNLTQQLIQEDGQIIVSTALGVTNFSIIFWHDDNPLNIGSLPFPHELLIHLRIKPWFELSSSARRHSSYPQIMTEAC